MFDSFLTKIFGSRNDRLVRQYRKRCAQINKLEPQMQALTDEQLQGKTAEFRDRRSMRCCPKRSRLCAKPAAVFSACATSTFSSSAAWF